MEISKGRRLLLAGAGWQKWAVGKNRLLGNLNCLKARVKIDMCL